MKFYSLKDKNHSATFAQAIINGLAPNNALYFPKRIPVFSNSFFTHLHEMSLPEIAKQVLLPYVDNDISEKVLEEIVNEVFNFKIPLVEVEHNIFALELFHGPTLAFKDVGARFFAKSMQYLKKEGNIKVIVATSGDTGSAVANAFYGIDGVEVIVLYPKGKVSEIQQKQFTTLGKNIKPIAIDGTFDDCQRLVKLAFADASLNSTLTLTSANSINVARWIPQSVYYYWAYAQLKEHNPQIAIAVPSGNLGNLTAGLLAKKTGLPVNHFIASSNQNNIVPNFLKTGVYSPKASVTTIANAMDVGKPNNFPRLLEMFNGNYPIIKEEISGYAYSDEQIRQTIRECFFENNYLLDPHGATGYAAIKSYCKRVNSIGVFLETAHHGKFHKEVENTIDARLELPQKLQDFVNRDAVFEELPANYKSFKEYLIDKCFF